MGFARRRDDKAGAAWNTREGRSDTLWDSTVAGPGKAFDVGNVVGFSASAAPANFPFPHATEDRILDNVGSIHVKQSVALNQVAAVTAAGVSATLEAAFDAGLTRAPSGKAYVQDGHVGRSLGSIEVYPNQLSLFVGTNVYNAKQQLRANLLIGGATYDLSVPADAARSRWKQSGVGAVVADMQASQKIHIRLGLARPFAGNPCYAQINGLYFL